MKRDVNPIALVTHGGGSGWIEGDGLVIGLQTFKASGTYTPIAGTEPVVVQVQRGRFGGVLKETIGSWRGGLPQ